MISPIPSTARLGHSFALSCALTVFVVAWMDDVVGVPAVYVARLDGSLRVSGTQRIDTDADAASFPWVRSLRRHCRCRFVRVADTKDAPKPELRIGRRICNPA
jgi:hypothetical protein